MKKISLIAMFALVCNFALAQIQQTSYKGAFAPSVDMWAKGWSNFDPQTTVYPAVSTDPSNADKYVLKTDITSNMTLDGTKTYELRGLVTVRNNATLTIPAGTVIRSSAIASALLIARGSKLIANGTATQPIVFTSKNDPGSRARGNWGGIVLLGKANYNTNNGVNFIEGITQTPITEFGGGTNPILNDNSGVLRYVRIEFAGYVFASNNELNGLTMGAVGSGTTIENVQVSYSNDDSFEWFGGTVNCKNLIAFAGLDDDFDVDSGYKGNVQFGLSIKDPGFADVSTSEIFEVDNNSGGNETTVNTWANYTSATFSNFTCIGPNKRPTSATTFATVNTLHDTALRLRRASRVNIFNSIFLDTKRGVRFESVFSNTAYNATTATAKFKNNVIVTPETTATVAIPNPVHGLVYDTVSPYTGANGANAATATWFPTTNNVVLADNTGILVKPYNDYNATNYKLIGEGDGTIDYRPSSIDVTTGADFTDDKFTGIVARGTAPAVSNPADYCKGVIALPLTASMTATGVSLRWYTATTATAPLATSQTYTTAAPVPSTTTPGTKFYFVREVNAGGSVSEAATITVKVIAAPTVALTGLIAGTVNGVAITAAVTSLVGTATQVTYTVPASTEAGVTNYLWTVPAGVTIVSQGAGTAGNSIVVTYQNVPAGILSVGNIAVQARNAALCGGPIKTLAITAALPVAPAVVVINDDNLPLKAKNTTITDATTGLSTTVTTYSPVAVTSMAPYMGTTNTLKVIASPGASSYVWELPTGVNHVSLPANPTVSEKYYILFPFVAPSDTPPTRTSSNGGQTYYKVTTTTYSDGTKKAECKFYRFARAAVTLGGLKQITEITDMVITNKTFANDTSTGDILNGSSFAGVTINPAYPITSTTSNVINVNFAGVTKTNSYAYTATKTNATGVVTETPTNVVRIGVKSQNGVGVSTTPNVALLNPTTTSTAKLLTLTAIAPTAPAAITMTNPTEQVATGVKRTPVTVITNFIGTTTSFTLTATPSPFASSYTWDLPDGVNLVSGALTGSSSNEITLNFNGVTSGKTTLVIGVTAVNVMGSSKTNNSAFVPATTSTAKLLKLTAAVPATPTTLVMNDLSTSGSPLVTVVTEYIGTGATLVLTAQSLPAGLSYLWDLPTCVTRAAAIDGTETITELTSTTNTIYVRFDGVKPAAGTIKFGVRAVNAVGASLAKELSTTAALPAVVGPVTGELKICSTKVTNGVRYTIAAVPAGALKYNITVPTGCTINATGSDTATINATAGITFTVNYPNGFTADTTNSIKRIIIQAENGVGVNSAASKFIQLTNTGANCTGARIAAPTAVTAVSATEVYPNPVSNDFNIDVTAAQAGILTIAIYSLDNNLVVSPRSVKLQEGANTINENVSSLNKGIYIVQLVNSSNGEVITKKLVKN